MMPMERCPRDWDY